MQSHRVLFSSLILGIGAVACVSPSPQVQSDTSRDTIPAVVRPQQADPPVSSGEIVRTGLLDTLPADTQEVISGEVAARIRVTVNGAPILEEEVQAAAYQFMILLQRLPPNEREEKKKEILNEAMDQLIERELILQDAYARLKNAPKTMDRLKDASDKEFDRRWISAMKKGNGFKTDDQLKESLRRQGLSLDTIRRQWTRQFMATEYMRSRVMPAIEKIGLKELRDYYEAHQDEFKVEDSVDYQDIFISAARFSSTEEAQKFAEGLVKRVQAGEDFAALCEKHDDGDSKLRKAEGIGHKRGEIQPRELEDYLFRMPEGKVGPVINIGSGFHVFRLVRREYAGVKPFDEQVQKEIRGKLRAEVFGKEAKQLITQLRTKAVIEYANLTRK